MMGPVSRRAFLKKMAKFSALGTAGGFASNLASFNAHAADTEGYKALVCVFLFGGLDGHDTVIPYDQASYDLWRNLRDPLINSGGEEGGYNGTRERDALLQLSGVNIGGQEFALGPEMSALHDLFESGAASIVGNVGPLIEPLNRSQFLSSAVRVPPQLFSHNDQQNVWLSSNPEGAQTGWGGRIADMILSGQTNSTFTAIPIGGESVFLSGLQTRQFTLGLSGAAELEALDPARNQILREAFEANLRDTGGSLSNIFERDIVDIGSFSLDANAEFTQALSGASAPMNVPEDNRLASQLALVSQVINQQALLGASRQVFFVSIGGFDTHDNQANALPALQTQVSEAVRFFYDEMVNQGREQEVVTFTASDFGRTLQVNGDGTDHGWGGHQFVVGGAVNGGQLLGEIPLPEFNHNLDAGRGRLIPSLSVDQFAASLARWYGLNDTEIADAIPGIVNFDINALDGLFSV